MGTIIAKSSKVSDSNKEFINNKIEITKTQIETVLNSDKNDTNIVFQGENHTINSKTLSKSITPCKITTSAIKLLSVSGNSKKQSSSSITGRRSNIMNEMDKDTLDNTRQNAVTYNWCSMKKREFILEFKEHMDIIYDLDEWTYSFNEESTQQINHADYIYHYTSYSMAKKCLRDNLIKSKNFLCKQDKMNNNKIDSPLPNGVILTCLLPEYSDSVLFSANLRNSQQQDMKSKIKCAFAIRKNSLKTKPVKLDDKYGRNIWLYKGDIDLSEIEFKVVLRTFLCDENYAY